MVQAGNYVICKGSDETVACQSEISGCFAHVCRAMARCPEMSAEKNISKVQPNLSAGMDVRGIFR